MIKKLTRIDKKIIIIILLMLCFRFTSMIYIVNGESMLPSLNDKDIGMAIRAIVIEPERFNIVVVKQDNKYLIKRVIGLPNDFVVYKNNELYINGQFIEDKYGSGNTSDFEIQLEKDEYYCLGDNREHSADSRVYGPFNKQDILAVLLNK